MDDDAELGGLGKWVVVAVFWGREFGGCFVCALSLPLPRFHPALLIREEGREGNRIDGLGGCLLGWVVGWMDGVRSFFSCVVVWGCHEEGDSRFRPAGGCLLLFFLVMMNSTRDMGRAWDDDDAWAGLDL